MDPVVHHSLSPYNAFDNNPVFWADPSGADAEFNYENLFDIFGRNRFDRFGNYIPSTDRGEIDFQMIDALSKIKQGFITFQNNILDLGPNGYIMRYDPEQVVTWEKDDGDTKLSDMKFEIVFKYEHIERNLFGTSWDDFISGFNEADRSNMNSASAWTGYAGLHLNKTESLLKYVGATDDVLKVTKSLGKKLGYAGVIFSTLEDIQSDKVGVGTGVKAVIGITTTVLATAFPVATLAYAILDITVGVVTDTNLTDRIASGIEYATKN